MTEQTQCPACEHGLPIVQCGVCELVRLRSQLAAVTRERDEALACKVATTSKDDPITVAGWFSRLVRLQLANKQLSSERDAVTRELAESRAQTQALLTATDPQASQLLKNVGELRIERDRYRKTLAEIFDYVKDSIGLTK